MNSSVYGCFNIGRPDLHDFDIRITSLPMRFGHVWPALVDGLSATSHVLVRSLAAKKKHAVTWSIAGVLLALSVAVSILGITSPFITSAADNYSVAAALRQLVHPTVPTQEMARQ